MSINDPKISIGTRGPANNTSIDSSKHLGYLGAFFGGLENAPTSISGFIVVLLIGIGALNVWFRPKIAMEYCKSIVVPIVSALFGYLFGKHSR